MDGQSRHGSPLFTNNDSLPPTPSLTNITSHFFAIIFCYLVGVFGLKVFFIAPLVILFLNHWRECYETFVWVVRLRIEYLEIKKTVHKHGESVQWLNTIVDRWWTTCEGTISRFVQDWMEPIACKFKLDHVVEYLKILTFSTGPSRSKFSNLHILQKVSKPKSSKDDVNVFIPITYENLLYPPIVSTTEGRCTFALEVDAELNVPSSDLKMKAKLGGVNQKLLMNIESFYLSGRVQCVVNVDRRAPFPHLSTADVCFLPTPKLKVNCRTLKDKVDISTTPILKQIGEKYIEREFQRILVYPKKEHVDFTPTLPPGCEWSTLRDSCGLSEGVLTVNIQPVRSENGSIKKSSLGIHSMKLNLSNQKCQSRLLSDEWSSTFSFLVHDCYSEKLVTKLKLKRKMRQGLISQKLEISLASLGIGVEDTDQELTDKKVQMSAGGIQLLFTLSYTALPKISLTYPIPSLDNCSTEDSGVLYIHVHGCQGIIPSAIKADCRPYCVVKQGSDTILRTHSLPCGISTIAWESGYEMLIRSCRGLELTFEIFSDGGTLGSHESLGWTSLRLSSEQSQLIQNRIPLTCPLRKLHKTQQQSHSIQPCIYVSIIYRRVESVNLTRDSLQEAFLQRTRHGSLASCLDGATKFLNPLNQGYEVTNVLASSAQMSSGDEDEEDSLLNGSVDDCSGRVMSGLEDSLVLTIHH